MATFRATLARAAQRRRGGHRGDGDAGRVPLTRGGYFLLIAGATALVIGVIVLSAGLIASGLIDALIGDRAGPAVALHAIVGAGVGGLMDPILGQMGGLRFLSAMGAVWRGRRLRGSASRTHRRMLLAASVGTLAVGMTLYLLPVV